ncbi:MAG: glutathione-disulfide reductase [Rhodospirillales bacterium]
MSDYEFDLFVIGAGSGGVRAARVAAALGKKVGIAENLRIGGTCVMRGCVPKKLLVYGSHYGEEIEDAHALGWTVDPAETKPDWAHLIGLKNKELERLEGVYHRLLDGPGVELVDGKGVLVDAHTVAVGERTVTAETILVATGGWPSLPDIPGIEHAITSNEALEITELPESMVIVGGGYIAVEFAGIFNAAGVKVTEIIRAANILRGFDEDVRVALRDEMIRRGIDIRDDSVIERIDKRDDGGYCLTFTDGWTLDTDCVMYATGRRPNTAGIGLEDVGVEVNDKGAIVVDEYSKTSVDNIYAIGDVTDRIALTPVAIGEAMALIDTLYKGAPRAMDYDFVPSAVFSQPPIGSVGLTEAQARETFGDIDVYVSRFRPMKLTLTPREERSMMKLIVDRASDRVVGLHMVGVDAPEITQGFAVAMKAGATKAQFDATVGIHPTSAEEFVTMREKRPD